MQQQYIGRFAPSPSGPLHLGSLVCALASYLDAKTHNGLWLLRIEDLDPPREQAEAPNLIKKSLASHGLLWDEEVIFQSQRHNRFRNRLDSLITRDIAYRCNCVRKRLSEIGRVYDGKCLKHPPQNNEKTALRLNVHACLQDTQLSNSFNFKDRLQGQIHQELKDIGDFIIHRKDGLFAYQLAVVSDDIDQEISHVVRGCDLLDMTAQQSLLFHVFGKAPPQYMHTPILLDENDRKLSKQNHAPALNNQQASLNLIYACRALGMTPNLKLVTEEPAEILSWAKQYWPSQSIHNKRDVRIRDIM